jgi:hypothetical protein
MDEYRRTGRVVGLAALAVVLVAIALLIAGQGVAVGVGALVGLMLGAAGGLAFVLWLTRHDPSGRSASFAFGPSSDGEPSPEFIREMHEMADVSGVDLGVIRAVRQVLYTAEANGLSVQLVSMEERVGGLLLIADVRAAPGVRMPMGIAVVSVTDDRATRYQAGSQGQSGSPSSMRFEVAIVPIPPPQATRLEIAIERFLDPFPGRERSTTGPWTLEVVLG